MKIKYVMSMLTAVAIMSGFQKAKAVICEVKVLGWQTGTYVAKSESDCNCFYATSSGPFQDRFTYCTSVSVEGKKVEDKTSGKIQEKTLQKK